MQHKVFSMPLLAALALLAAGPAFAGRQSHGAIPAEIAEVEPSAAAHFRCELRPFDLTKGLFCYGPAAIRSAYGLNGLIDGGSNGAGQTIVILDAYGSPTIQHDLKLFDKVFGIPDPPAFNIVTMPGTPPFDPKDGNIVGWTAEIALDVQWAHAMAPGANIVLVAAASNNDSDLIDGLNYALDHHLGNVVSMSFGESESALGNPDGFTVIDNWQAAFAKAGDQRVTLFVSSGDQGSTNVFDNAGDVLPFQNVSFPASSPLVTAVGGTNLYFGSATAANPNGSYQGEAVWNDGFGAGGGGISALLAEPDFQRDNLARATQATLHRHRAVPDIAYNAGVVGGVLVVWSVAAPDSFFLFGGTSAGAPQWAGVIADVNSAVGHPVGYLNNKLYRLGGRGALVNLTHDVTAGDNSFLGVPGYPAAAGYDLATGWGTPNLGKLAATLGRDGD